MSRASVARFTTNLHQRRGPYKNVFAGLKWCPRCARFRSRDDFGIDIARRDGLSGWCRPCRANDEKGRRDGNLTESRAACRTRYERNPDMHKAHVAVARAVAKKLLSKPTKCPVCNRRRRIEAHHHLGYERKHWLHVVWRCRQCHPLEHKRGPLRAANAA